MRIAHVTPYDLAIRGGVNATVTQLAMRQSALGHHVDVLGGASKPDVNVEGLRRIRAWFANIPINGSIAALSIPSAPGPEGDLAATLASEAYDVVVAHEPELVLSAIALAFAPGARVGVMHAFSERMPEAPALIRLITPSLLQLDRAVAVSTAAREFARRYMDAPFTIIPNGIDPPQDVSLVRTGATILFLGRPEPRKGLATLLDAFAMLLRERPAARLVVAGDGTDEQWRRYRDQAAALGIERATAFVGRVDDDAKRALFSSATVYCSPATGGESQGIVLLEAMAAGTPVVASDITGYRTVVAPERDGILVPPQDARALGIAVRRVLDDPAAARRLAVAARDKVIREYDWRVVVPKHVAVYRDAIERHANPGAGSRTTVGRAVSI